MIHMHIIHLKVYIYLVFSFLVFEKLEQREKKIKFPTSRQPINIYMYTYTCIYMCMYNIETYSYVNMKCKHIFHRSNFVL